MYSTDKVHVSRDTQWCYHTTSDYVKRRKEKITFFFHWSFLCGPRRCKNCTNLKIANIKVSGPPEFDFIAVALQRIVFRIAARRQIFVTPGRSLPSLPRDPSDGSPGRMVKIKRTVVWLFRDPTVISFYYLISENLFNLQFNSRKMTWLKNKWLNIKLIISAIFT